MALTQYTLQDHKYGTTASHDVSAKVNFPVFIDVQCTYQWRFGQGALTWMTTHS